MRVSYAAFRLCLICVSAARGDVTSAGTICMSLATHIQGVRVSENTE